MRKPAFLNIFIFAFILFFLMPFCSAVVISQGDSIVKADIVRSTYAINGSGIKIGVISDGIDSLSLMQKMGELPSGVTVLSNKNGGDEGTKMLQIIHDIAPGAQLFFHDSGVSPREFNEAINALISAGCQIICDDVNWIADPVFEDGETSTYINDLNLENRS